MAQRGVIYLVSGVRSYLAELQISLRSLRRHEPELPVTVFSRFALPKRARCEHRPFSSPEHPLKQKVLVLAESPYEETLFLDTDTTIFGPIRDIFAYLRDHDFAIAEICSPNLLMPADRRAPGLPVMYNTGVLLYRKTPPVKKFFGKWTEAVLAQDPKDMWGGHNCDQHYFNLLVKAGAIADCGVRMAVLPNTIYNVRSTIAHLLKNNGQWPAVRIYHHRTLAMKLLKAVYATTDPLVAREIALKILRRIKGVR